MNSLKEYFENLINKLEKNIYRYYFFKYRIEDIREYIRILVQLFFGIITIGAVEKIVRYFFPISLEANIIIGFIVLLVLIFVKDRFEK